MRRSVCSAAKALSSMPFGRTVMLTQPMASPMNRINFPVISIAQRSISDNNKPKIKNKRQKMKSTLEEMNYPDDPRTIDEIALGVETTLTPEQRTFVEMLKKRMSGGAPSQRVSSIYRDIADPLNLPEVANMFPKLAPNPQELIDFALSHVPPRAGPRRSRRKKRAALKFETKRKYDKIKKMQNKAANMRVQAKHKKERIKAKGYRAEALVISAARAKWEADSIARLKQAGAM